jgi:hypothetical protein
MNQYSIYNKAQKLLTTIHAPDKDWAKDWARVNYPVETILHIRPAIDTEPIKRRIKALGLQKKWIADRIGMNSQQFSKALIGYCPFTETETKELNNILGIN